MLGSIYRGRTTINMCLVCGFDYSTTWIGKGNSVSSSNIYIYFHLLCWWRVFGFAKARRWRSPCGSYDRINFIPLADYGSGESNARTYVCVVKNTTKHQIAFFLIAHTREHCGLGSKKGLEEPSGRLCVPNYLPRRTCE